MGSCDQVSLPSKAMESFKVSVCMCLLVGLAQSAPQNTNEVVRTVTTQLQPLISDACQSSGWSQHCLCLFIKIWSIFIRIWFIIILWSFLRCCCCSWLRALRGGGA